jgi:hypothetical protein
LAVLAKAETDMGALHQETLNLASEDKDIHED